MTVQSVSVDARAGGADLRPKTITYTTDRHNTATSIEITGLPESVPSEGNRLVLELNGTLVFRGPVDSTSPTGKGAVTVTAYDAGLPLKRNTLTASYNDAPIGRIARDAIKAAGIARSTVDLPDVTESIEVEERQCDAVIEQVTMLGNAVWWVDAENRLHVEQEPPSELHELRWIKPETSAGLQEPPYQSVLVFGVSPTSAGGSNRTGGREAAHLLSSDTVAAQAGTGQPQYNYRSPNIQSDEAAQNTADRLLEELKRQQGSGEIVVVGDERIRPLDVVEFPDDHGGAAWFVSAVTHEIDASNGWTTRITPGQSFDTDPGSSTTPVTESGSNPPRILQA